jgi:hypothetical protein
LSSKVKALQTALGLQETGVACAVLSGFSSEVNAQTGKKIDAATASELLTGFAQPIGGALGCT